MSRGLSLAFFATLGLAPGLARASGFDSPQVGPATSSVVTADAAAVALNPGQLGYVERAELMVGVGVIVGSLGYQRDRLGQYQFQDNLDFAEPIDPMDIDAAKTGAADGFRTTPVGPNASIFVALPVIRDRFALGLGLYVPYAAVVDAPFDGPQRWAAQDVLLLAAHTTLSAGVKLHDKVSIGAGVTYVLGALELSKVQDFAAVQSFADGLAGDPINQANDFGPDAPSTVRELDVLARQIELGLGLSHSVSFNAGIAIQPTDELDLALVYQHGSRMKFRSDFRLDMDDDFFTQDLAAQGLQFPPVVAGEAEVRLRLPKRIAAGFGYDIVPKFRLELTGQYVFYQDFDTIDIRLKSPGLAQPALGIGQTVDQPLVRNWQGAGIVEATGKIRPTKKLGLTVLAGYHSPASPDATIDMASPDGHRLIFGAGFGYDITDKFTLLMDVEGQAMVPRTVTTSDYDLGNGVYRLFLAHIGLTARTRFGFAGRPAKRAAAQPDAKAAEASPEAAPTERPDPAAPEGAATGAPGETEERPAIDAEPEPPADGTERLPPPPPPPSLASAGSRHPFHWL